MLSVVADCQGIVDWLGVLATARICGLAYLGNGKGNFPAGVAVVKAVGGLL